VLEPEPAQWPDEQEIQPEIQRHRHHARLDRRARVAERVEGLRRDARRGERGEPDGVARERLRGGARVGGGELAALEQEISLFEKPVALAHGDTHFFRVDKPLRFARDQRVYENFIRVETFGSPHVHWVRAVVDLDDRQVFSFKPQLVRPK